MQDTSNEVSEPIQNNSFDNVVINRLISERVFANKNLDLGKIKAIGFDMDYTIAPYREEYYKLQFDLTVKNLI